MWRVILRGLVSGGVLAGVFGLLQALRLGPALVEAGELGAWGLLGRLLLGSLGLMSVAIPAGFLVSGLVTYREREQRGEWLALRTLGVGRGWWVRGCLLAGLAGSLVSGVFAFEVGPAGLAGLAVALEEVGVAGRVGAGAGRPVALGPGVWVAASGVRRSPEGAVLEEAWGVDVRRGVGFRAAEARPTGARWLLRGASLRWWGPGGASASASAATAEVALPAGGEGASPGAAAVPWIEQQGLGALWASARGGDARARRALAKRAALVASPPGLLWVALGLVVPGRPGRRVAGAGRVGLLGLGVGAGFFGLLRAGELWGGASGWWLAGVLPLSGLLLAGVWSTWELWRRW